MARKSTKLGRGAHLHLHVPRHRDAAEAIALARRSRALHRGWIQPPMDTVTWAAYLERISVERSAGFLLRRNQDDAIVGMVNVNEIVRGAFQNAFLGYWVGGPYAGQGYMTEGLGLVLRRAFGPLKLHRVEANIQPKNAASIAVARRLGFRHEGRSERYLKISGRWRDHERFALLAEDWRRRRR